MPTRARPPSVSRKQTIRFGKRSSRRVCNNGNSSGGVNVVKDALPTACDSQGHAKWRTRPYGPLPRLHQTTSFSLRNWRSSRRGRFIARLFADKSESPPVIHSNYRHDVTLETNHLGFVTTKRSVYKQRMCKRSYLDSSTVSLTLRTVYERFVWEVSTIYALSPLPRRVTIHTGCCHQPPYQSILDYQDIKRQTENPPKCLLRFNTWP